MPIDLDQASYKRFRDIVTERTRPVILWIGAGLSMPAEMPSWAGLRSHLQRALEKKASTFIGDEGKRFNNQAFLLRSEKNLWIYFERAKTLLGETSFIGEIRNALSNADSKSPPEIYSLLWDLPIRGIISLNLDRFASRAYPLNKKHPEPFQLHGLRSASSMANPFKQTKPFVVNLHGSLDQSETWVFTHSELEDLKSKPFYKTFVDTCLTGFSVLFLGITAEDVAVGGHLERLVHDGIDPNSHFWVTDRRDVTVDGWAQKNSIEPIYYTTKDQSHSELNILVRDLRRYIPKDSLPDPIAPQLQLPLTNVSVPSNDELRALNPEQTRKLLNKHAIALLENSSNGKDDYQKFCDEYREAIHKCWFLNEKPPNNSVLGYTLEEKIETGGFGTVYRARDTETGEALAVKVLRPEVFSTADLLQSFRRGVRSMKILTDRGVQGIVRCRNAFEIPTAVVMNWVDGPSLDHAVRIGILKQWSDLLPVALQLALAIQRGHLLPERVLHRDIRPKNVMLNDYYTDNINYEVVVLDFDLSWHQGALEQSVTAGRSFSGYLAPEQAANKAGVSTRNAAVDSFGLGMTLYFAISGHDPLPSEHLHAGWSDKLLALAASKQHQTWKSIPARFTRLISQCTHDEQAKRNDFSEIVLELSRLSEADLNPESITYGDMLSEELAAIIHNGNPSRYKVNQENSSVHFTTVVGVSVSIYPIEKRRMMSIEIAWNDSGLAERKKIGKYVTEKIPGIRQALTSGGWESVTDNYAAGALALSAETPIANLATNIVRHAKAIEDALSRVNF